MGLVVAGDFATGVIIDKPRKSSKQCAKAEAAANALLGMIHSCVNIKN